MDLLDRNQRLTTRGIVYKHGIEKGIHCHINTDFDGGWYQSDADNEKYVMSCTGYVITYTG